ncbi:uncharacterized protein LOC124640242 [Helicoverpa zea]|uniref:uncharacterized protein LOC124640242 n=1 Tax=Helicoverpa zea TaxID=7113 RepID=UPI001F5A930F|nr:uncharacterized protein LOC124640242 [Helicoverpa zea]
MYTNMCVKIAVCLALVVSIDSHVLKHHEVPLSPEGMVVEITVKNKGNEHPVSSMKIDIDGKDKKILLSLGEPSESVPKAVGEATSDVVPTIETRNNIRVGSCPSGYTRRGGFCFPDDDY